MNAKSEPRESTATGSTSLATRTTDFWHPFQQLRQQIDRAFEDLGGNFWHLPWSRSSDASNGMSLFSSAVPAVDLAEKEDCYELTAELPGLDEKDIEVTCTPDGYLILKGEKTAEREEKKKDYHLSERRYGSFQRSFRLPPEVNIDKIDAQYNRGVLKLTLPKRPEAVQAARRIDIKTH